MNVDPTLNDNLPHLTPANLVGRKFDKNTFRDITVALIGYCPRPSNLDKYCPTHTSDQFFIHVAPSSVEICTYQGIDFLSFTHIYGGPVSSALVEELAYYGIRYVLAYGLAGSLGTKRLKIGDYYLVEKALAMDGTTPHYTKDHIVFSDDFLNSKILHFATTGARLSFAPVQALTADALYREYRGELEQAKENGCDIVNCDSSHLFAASRLVGIRSTECGVVSDIAMNNGRNWESALAMMLSPGEQGDATPLTLTELIVEFYVEVLMAELTSMSSTQSGD